MTESVDSLVWALWRIGDRRHPCTVARAAALLGVQRFTLHNWIACGHVRTLRPLGGRIYPQRVPWREVARLRAKQRSGR